MRTANLREMPVKKRPVHSGRKKGEVVVVGGRNFAGALESRGGPAAIEAGRPGADHSSGRGPRQRRSPAEAFAFAIVPAQTTRANYGCGRDPLLVQCSRRGAGGPWPPSRNIKTRGPTGSAGRRGGRPTTSPGPHQAGSAGVTSPIFPGEAERCCGSPPPSSTALLFGIGVLGLVIGGLSSPKTVTAAVFEKESGDFGHSMRAARAANRSPAFLARDPGRGPSASHLGGDPRVGLDTGHLDPGGTRAHAAETAAGSSSSPRASWSSR